MTINERFFKLLDEKKVSQKDFCEATGIPKQTVSGWKNRKTDPPASLSSLSEVEKNIVLGKAAEFYLKSLSED